jgi:hypothetical protein
MFTGLATMKLQARRMGRVVFLNKRSMQVKNQFGAAVCRPTHQAAEQHQASNIPTHLSH